MNGWKVSWLAGWLVNLKHNIWPKKNIDISTCTNRFNTASSFFSLKMMNGLSNHIQSNIQSQNGPNHDILLQSLYDLSHSFANHLKYEPFIFWLGCVFKICNVFRHNLHTIPPPKKNKNNINKRTLQFTQTHPQNMAWTANWNYDLHLGWQSTCLVDPTSETPW